MKALVACWFCTLALAVGCSDSRQGDVEKAEKSAVASAALRRQNLSTAATRLIDANARLAQTVALARVHLKHDEHEQAEQLLLQTLADPIATDKHAAIALLDAARRVDRSPPTRTLARYAAPDVQPSETTSLGQFVYQAGYTRSFRV